MSSLSAPSDEHNFHKFFDSWLSEHNQIIHDLISAVNSRERTHPSRGLDDERVLRPLINRGMQHYDQYYLAKSRWEKKDVLAMLSPSWRSSLEKAFLWIGGWRPSMAFHLLYSKAGLQFESRFADLIRGLTTGDLGDLSANQLNQVDDLHRKTIKDEKEITEKMAKHQETIADKSMVELSQIATESLRDGQTNGDDNRTADEHVQMVLESKEEGLEEIIQNADGLRLKTLKGIINILNATQAVHFMIGAAELHLRVHEWGMRKDAEHNRRPNR